MEEVFNRVETMFTSDSAKLAWLSSFERPERGKNRYTLSAVELRDELIVADRVEKDYKKTTEVEKLNELRRELDSLKFYGGDIKSNIQSKIDKISSELKKLTEQRREQRLAEEEEEKLRLRQEREEIRKQELLIAKRIAQEERLESEDARKRKNAQRKLEKMKDRGEI